MRLFFTGDVHGTHSIQKFYKDRWPEGRSLTKEDKVFIAGDIGAVWDGGKDDVKAQKRYMEFPWETYAVVGNHENFQRINDLPIVEKFGGPVRKVNHSLYYLETGNVYNINGKTLFAFGGGLSIDQEYRTPYKSWWPEEIPSMSVYKNAYEKLSSIKKVDIVLTHATFENSFLRIPRVFGLERIDHPKYKDPLLKMLQSFKDIISYKDWYCGHYHIDYFDQENMVHYLYHSIEELK